MQNETALLLGNKTSWKWHWALGFNAVFAILALPIMFLSVETPRYLLLERGKEDAARAGKIINTSLLIIKSQIIYSQIIKATMYCNIIIIIALII